ncbi:3'5'-cyclic nucleotide phosphodiesterase [Phytophthora infestans]|uniref:Phosphodiesterase n=1 Tax=Phytophthora infestans TaxID=4787 RepID=A0A833W639_PHYIN|nr:3'5'-cyclic nucleotide phosphodiesterase [Phytophthora infestans]
MHINMAVVVPLTPVQPIVPPLQPNISKRSMAVPRRSVPRAVVLVQQPTHPILCYFEDLDVEQKFQTYFRREWQTCIVSQMVSVLLVFAAFTCASSNAATLAITEAYADSIFAELEIVYSNKELLSTSSFSHALWLSDKSFAAIALIIYVLAGICIFHIWRRRGEYRFPRVRLDPVQLVLLLFFHCIIAPLFLVICAGIEKQTRLAKQLSVVHIDDVRLTSILLGEGFLDGLLFLELLGACVCTCLLRLQFTYCIFVVTELSIAAIVATGVHDTSSVVLNRRLAVLAVFLILLGLLLRIVREQERSTRRDFLTSFHLVTEARRLSSANLEMKEELSGKLNYELHYEMGDILRILCQIKVKMSAAEKLDIDKIITALVRNHDLFEVTLSSTMPEFEEEVQGWLHMMDFKDHPASSGDDPGFMTKPGSDGRRSRHYSLSNDILRVSTSRRLSTQKGTSEHFQASDDGLNHLLRSYSNRDDAFGAAIRPREEDLSNWLMDRLQNHFFVDIFYLEQHSCVKTNGLIDRLDLDEKKLVCFAAAVEERYMNRNPYHNRVHAAAVVADINFYLRRVHLSVDDSTLLVALVAAAAHDISHPGVSNGFLIATKSNLAITYSDDSVLERMHVAELYRILSHVAFDVFSNMEAAERAECRKIIIGMILATDLARHFQRISVLKTKTFTMPEQAQGLELSLLMETMLMLADLGHTAKPFSYHETWAERISEEFFRQGEAEERNHLPISPLCDRKQANLPRSQVTFLTLVATPLFETAGQVFSIDDYDSVISELRNNISMWKERIVTC